MPSAYPIRCNSACMLRLGLNRIHHFSVLSGCVYESRQECNCNAETAPCCLDNNNRQVWTFNYWIFIINALPSLTGRLGDIRLPIEWEGNHGRLYRRGKNQCVSPPGIIKANRWPPLWWRTCCYAAPNKTQVERSEAGLRRNQCVYTKLSGAFSERQGRKTAGDRAENRSYFSHQTQTQNYTKAWDSLVKQTQDKCKGRKRGHKIQEGSDRY